MQSNSCIWFIISLKMLQETPEVFIMAITYDNVSLTNLGHKLMVGREYGENVIHILNFWGSDKEAAEIAVSETPDTFVGIALIEKRYIPDSSIIGVYADDEDSVVKFWENYCEIIGNGHSLSLHNN